jgi:membrane-associated phospholipid phosphatase
LPYVLIREHVGARIVCGGIGALVILLVGLSRRYLGEHFLSDDLSGYLVGAFWVFWGIALAEWLRADATADRSRLKPWRRFWIFAVVACTGIAIWALVESYQSGLISLAVP